MFEYNHLLA